MILELAVTGLGVVMTAVVSVIGWFLKKSLEEISALATKLGSMATSITEIVTDRKRDTEDMAKVDGDIRKLYGKVEDVKIDIVKIKASHKALHGELIE